LITQMPVWSAIEGHTHLAQPPAPVWFTEARASPSRPGPARPGPAVRGSPPGRPRRVLCSARAAPQRGALRLWADDRAARKLLRARACALTRAPRALAQTRWRARAQVPNTHGPTLWAANLPDAPFALDAKEFDAFFKTPEKARGAPTWHGAWHGCSAQPDARQGAARRGARKATRHVACPRGGRPRRRFLETSTNSTENINSTETPHNSDARLAAAPLPQRRSCSWARSARCVQSAASLVINKHVVGSVARIGPQRCTQIELMLRRCSARPPAHSRAHAHTHARGAQTPAPSRRRAARFRGAGSARVKARPDPPIER
jgi:hypothetical protein